MQPFAQAVVGALGALVLFSVYGPPQAESAAVIVPGTCLQTVCEHESWPAKGCSKYGRKETERTPCYGGYVYTCCQPGADASELPQQSACDRGSGRCLPVDKTAAVAAGYEPFDGCRAYDTTDGVESPCEDGYQYVCCADRTPEEDDDDDNHGDDDHSDDYHDDDDHKDDDHDDDDHDDDDHDDDDHDDDDHDDDDHDDDDHDDDDHDDDDHGDDDHGDDDHGDDDQDDDDHEDCEDVSGCVKSGRMTYFHPTRTACGKRCTDSDMVGALGPRYFTNSNPNKDPICGKKVKIVDAHTSKSVVIRVVDKCGGCSKNDINVSPAAFKKLKCLKDSVIDVKWAFVS